MNLRIDAVEFREVIDAAVSEAIHRLDAQRPRDAAGRVLLTKREAAEALGVSEATVDRLRKSDLPCVKLDGRAMFRPEALETWAAAKEGGAK